MSGRFPSQSSLTLTSPLGLAAYCTTIVTESSFFSRLSFLLSFCVLEFYLWILWEWDLDRFLSWCLSVWSFLCIFSDDEVDLLCLCLSLLLVLLLLRTFSLSLFLSFSRSFSFSRSLSLSRSLSRCLSLSRDRELFLSDSTS